MPSGRQGRTRSAPPPRRTISPGAAPHQRPPSPASRHAAPGAPTLFAAHRRPVGAFSRSNRLQVAKRLKTFARSQENRSANRRRAWTSPPADTAHPSSRRPPGAAGYWPGASCGSDVHCPGATLTRLDPALRLWTTCGAWSSTAHGHGLREATLTGTRSTPSREASGVAGPSTSPTTTASRAAAASGGSRRTRAQRAERATKTCGGRWSTLARNCTIGH